MREDSDWTSCVETILWLTDFKRVQVIFVPDVSFFVTQ